MKKIEKISDEGRGFIKQFIVSNNIKSAVDIQDALKDMFKDTLQEMLVAELKNILGHEKYEYSNI